jgi:hypothetical protein
MESRIKEALNQTWETIGYDILEANDRKDVTREVVIEMVLDADSFKTYGGDEEAIAAFYNLTKEERKEMLRKAFPHERYGY